jgi:pheromone shutdown-related protein TraB
MADTSDADTPPELHGNVTRLDFAGKELYLVGTAHVSRQSVEEVRRVVAALRPDTVCVELDRGRYETLVDETRWRKLDVRDVLARGKLGLFLSSLLFAGFQKRLGDKLGVRPGAEMLAAVEEARRIGAEVVLADRDIQVTLMRCYARLRPLERAQISFVLAMLPFAAADIDEKQIEELKNREAISDVMTTFAREMPALQEPLIDDRDRYLVGTVRAAAGRRIVAVVGAAHVPGMTRHLSDPIDLDALGRAPVSPARGSLFAWVAPVLVASLVLLAGLRMGALSEASAAFALERIGRALGTALVLPTAIAAAACAFVAGGSALTALVAALLAPVSLLFPPLPFARWLGELEASLRRASPEDAVRLRDDVLMPARARKNGFLRPILVAFASPFGRTLGGAAGIVWALVRLVKIG